LGIKRYEKGPHGLNLWERLQNAVLDKLVRAKVAQRFGGRLKAFVSGGAPLNYDIGVFFLSLGVRLAQGYGQTETAPVVSCNPLDRIKIDTVGPALPGVEVKIAEDGELLVRGELTMQGYWNAPDLSAEALKDGWVHTGDIAELDADGYIKITDRKKDIIVNSGGDNVSPQPIWSPCWCPTTSSLPNGPRKTAMTATWRPWPSYNPSTKRCEAQWRGSTRTSRRSSRCAASSSPAKGFPSTTA
jgi:long-chain acyl-CoA synthetase